MSGRRRLQGKRRCPPPRAAAQPPLPLGLTSEQHEERSAQFNPQLFTLASL